MTAAAGVSTVGLTAVAGCVEETSDEGSDEPAAPSTGQPAQTSSKPAKKDVKILNHEMYTGEYKYGVKGKLKNQTDRSISSVEVTATFFDGEGTRIGEGLDFLSDLSAGTTATFDAVATDMKSDTVEKYEIEVSPTSF